MFTKILLESTPKRFYWDFGFMLSALLMMSFASLAPSAYAESGFYSLKTALNGSKKDLDFASLKGKVVLIANTASECGYTPQYKGLQNLYETYKDQGLVVIGFPSKSFKQEFDSEDKVKQFCEFRYGVKFPLAKTQDVTGKQASPVFKYLSKQADDKGEVKWNFEKFLVDRQGKEVQRFRSRVEPKDMESHIKKLLAEKTN